MSAFVRTNNCSINSINVYRNFVLNSIGFYLNFLKLKILLFPRNISSQLFPFSPQNTLIFRCPCFHLIASLKFKWNQLFVSKRNDQVTRWIIHQRLVDIQIPRFGRWPISIIYIKRDMETQVTRVIPLVSINNVSQWKWLQYRFNCVFSIRLFHPRRHSIVVSMQRNEI